MDKPGPDSIYSSVWSYPGGNERKDTMAAERKAYYVRRESDAYVTTIEVHLTYEYRNYPEDWPETEFALILPGLVHGEGFERHEQPPITLEHLNSIQEVTDVLGRYFEDSDAPEQWTRGYLNGNKDKRLQLLQAQTELAQHEQELQRLQRRAQNEEADVHNSRARIAKLQAEIEKEQSDGK